MPILVCRIAWMPFYQDTGESAYSGDRWVAAGNTPFEAVNFLSVDGFYYGYVAIPSAHNLSINNLGARAGDDQVEGILVLFCAPHPATKDLLLVGWYKNATVYRNWIDRPDSQPVRFVRFKSTEATLVEEIQRGFFIPRAKDKLSIGGIGQAPIWYGLNENKAKNKNKAKQFAIEINQYISQVQAEEKQEPPTQTMLESKRRSKSLALERHGSVRDFIKVKGYRCEACGLKINEDEQHIWGSSFELHHLTPFDKLRLDEVREVNKDDFAVLCATCHRAIHRWGYQGGNISNVDEFSRNYLEPCPTLCRRKPRTPE